MIAQRVATILSAIFAVASSWSCTDGKIKAEVEANIQVPPPPTQPAGSGGKVLKSIPDLSKLSGGVILLKPGPNMETQSLLGYVVGYPNTLLLEPTTEDRFFVANVPAGAQKLYVRGKTTSGNSVSKIFNDVQVLQSSITNVDVSSLETSISTPKKIVVVDIESQTPVSGIKCEIIGTDLACTEVSQGTIQFDELPAGYTDIVIAKEGYRQSVLMKVPREELPSLVSISPVVGSNGIIQVAGGTIAKAPGNRQIFVAPPDDSNGVYDEMRVAIDDEPGNMPWLPYRSSFSHQFRIAKNGIIKAQFRGSKTKDQVSQIVSLDYIVGSVPTALYSRTRYAIAALDELLFFAGGYRVQPPQGSVNVVSVFNQSEGTWTGSTLTEPVAVSGAASSTNRRYLVVAGGRMFGSGFNYQSAMVNVFDRAAGIWSSKDMSIARSIPEIVPIDDYFLIVGGESNFSNVAEKIYPSSLESEFLALPQARARLKAAFCGGKLFVVGGMTSSSEYSNRVDVYSSVTSTWQQISLSEAYVPAFAHSVSERLIIGGGYNQSGIVKTLDVVNCNNLEKTSIAMPTQIIQDSVFNDGNMVSFFGVSPAYPGISGIHYQLNVDTLELTSTLLPATGIGVSGKSTRFKDSIIFEGPRVYDLRSKVWSPNLY